MKIKEVKVYEFKELSEEAQDKAIEKLYDINVNYDWWDSVYADAKDIGLKITGFDCDRECSGNFILSANEVAQNIFNNHGKDCETVKTAADFMDKWQPVYDEYLDPTSLNYESSKNENELLELEQEFLESLLEDYRIMLRQDYEYLTSKEAIIDTIEANNYEFTEDGNIF